MLFVNKKFVLFTKDYFQEKEIDMENLTKEAAIEAMEQGGYKVAHRFFSEGEYIRSVDDEYYKDEEGTWLPKKDFWECRTKQEWETGWRIVG